MSVTAPERTARPRPLSPRWWVTDRDGHVVVAQWPNAALWVWLLALVARLTGVLGDANQDLLSGVGRGALIVWGLDEVWRGASPVRRLLGAVVLVVQVVGLLLAE
jgi:hypothetical protein